MTFTSLPEFECLTPLGPGRCKGFWVDGDVTEWLVDIRSTREPWWFRNEDFRFADGVTERGSKPSPFGSPNEPLKRQIERYRKNGWLEKLTEIAFFSLPYSTWRKYNNTPYVAPDKDGA